MKASNQALALVSVLALCASIAFVACAGGGSATGSDGGADASSDYHVGHRDSGSDRAVPSHDAGPDHAVSHDAGSTDASRDGTMQQEDAGVDAGCFTHPTTYLEIINACTDASFVDANPVLPLLEADGSLPPLP